jgi:hypothetical protein
MQLRRFVERPQADPSCQPVVIRQSPSSPIMPASSLSTYHPAFPSCQPIILRQSSYIPSAIPTACPSFWPDEVRSECGIFNVMEQQTQCSTDHVSIFVSEINLTVVVLSLALLISHTFLQSITSFRCILFWFILTSSWLGLGLGPAETP